MAAHKAGDLDEAIKFYKKSLELNYEAGKIYAMVANILLGQSRAANEAGDSVTGKAKQEAAQLIRNADPKLERTENIYLRELVDKLFDKTMSDN